MDEFIDKIKDGASKTKDAAGRIAKQVAKHTSNAITSTKLTYAINEANNKIKDIYSQIGKTMYEEYLDGATVNEQFADMFEKIDALMHDIEALQAKKAELKKATRCQQCDTLNPNDSDYCSKCGAKLEKQDDVSDDEPAEEVEIDEIVIE